MKKIFFFCLFFCRFLLQFLFAAEPCAVCDSLVLKDGRHIAVKIGAIYQNKVTYKPCDSLKAKMRAMSKREVERFVFMAGKAQFAAKPKINTPAPNTVSPTNPPQVFPPKLDLFSAASMFLAAIGIFPIALVFGIIGNSLTTKHPDEWYGKSYAQAGIFISVIWAILFVVLLVL